MDKRWLKLHKKMTLLWITRYINVWLFSNDPAIKTWTPAPTSLIYAQRKFWKRKNLSWGLEADFTPVVTTNQETDKGYLTTFLLSFGIIGLSELWSQSTQRKFSFKISQTRLKLSSEDFIDEMSPVVEIVEIDSRDKWVLIALTVISDRQDFVLKIDRVAFSFKIFFSSAQV